MGMPSADLPEAPTLQRLVLSACSGDFGTRRVGGEADLREAAGGAPFTGPDSSPWLCRHRRQGDPARLNTAGYMSVLNAGSDQRLLSSGNSAHVLKPKSRSGATRGCAHTQCKRQGPRVVTAPLGTALCW